MPIFSFLNEEKKKGTKFSELEDKENDVYVPILQAFIDEINSQYIEHKDIPTKMVEYLLSKFSLNSSNSADFYTPNEVSTLIAALIASKKRHLDSVYDPCCGSASLLLEIHKTIPCDAIYGQEINASFYNIARENMILHNIHYEDFDIKQGDTLEQPQHLGESFEAVVSQIPFNSKWSADKSFRKDIRFHEYNILAPRTKADYAFIQHMLYHLRDDGIITDSDDVWVIRKKPGDFMSCGVFFDGKSLKDVERINDENNLGLNIANVKRIVSIINFKESIREGLLDTVMYKMISSGGKYYGPRRAYLFAKEFKRNMELPIKYGDSSLIMDYLQNDGDGNLMCYIKYFDGDQDLSLSALEVLSCQNLIGNSNKVKRKVFN
jgi:hypothetical protein